MNPATIEALARFFVWAWDHRGDDGDAGLLVEKAIELGLVEPAKDYEGVPYLRILPIVEEQ